ncbi:methylated-DNA--[protein]-cysteine S-methyltransferase [Noviherbaspirillum massiliense]|uniref:methylated-DNA--[protein]-cysteine S-methyltransferase n=1 Tax=Noviherbaspirillum massiliense TaxID=1465823 RepID=UPI0002DCA758|nr:methylated-DNA--[protein]-cysteine S-methyltransferase [Noviherbaspirillum massiliense]
MTYYTEYSSPLGKLLLAATDAGLCGVYFQEGHKYFKGTQAWQPAGAHHHLQETARQLDEYFAGRRAVFELPLDMSGTAFQKSVWQELVQLPYGDSTSYRTIAQRLGNPKAVRAVGSAIGRNPVCIIVPCHRVLGTSGSLAGYAGGLERKRYLLAHERNCTSGT